MFFGGVYALIGLIITLLLFGAFYALVPYMFILEEPEYIYIRKKTSWYKKIFNKTKIKKEKVREKSKKIAIDKKENLNIKEGNTNNKDNSRDIFSN